jgi:hypothetical protein
VLGAVEVGVLRALFRAGHRPDLVVGTSVGAINGVLVAADPAEAVTDRLVRMWPRGRRARCTATRSAGNCGGSPPARTCTRPGRCAGCWNASSALRVHSPSWGYRSRGLTAAADRAAELRHVMAPQPGGVLAALDAAPRPA